MQAASIRKEVQQADQPIASSCNAEVRRSRRAPVPNSHYLSGIEELRKEARTKDQIKPPHGSKHRNESQPNSSTGLVQQSESIPQEEWIRCVLPGDQRRSIELQVIVEPPTPKEPSKSKCSTSTQARQHEESVEDESQKGAPRKKVKLSHPPAEQGGLLSMLLSIAVKVASETAAYKQVFMDLSSGASFNPSLPTPEKTVIKERKSPSSNYQQMFSNTNQLLETPLKENQMGEENKSNTQPNSPRAFHSCSGKAEDRFNILTDRFCQYKKKLTLGDHQ